MRYVVIHSDGSCFPNPGPGAWAAVLEFKDTGGRQEIFGRSEGVTTNNRMEMTAAIEALKSLGEDCMEVDLYTDSQYLKNGATSWIGAWSRKHFRGVKNGDLWKEILLLNMTHRIHWHWVRGHADCPENCRADALAENQRKLANATNAL